MSSADSLERLRSLAAYYKGVLTAQIRTTGRHYLDLGAVFSRGLVADLSPFVSSFDELVTRSELRFRIEPASSKDIETALEAAEQEETPGTEVTAEEKIALLTRRQMSARMTAIYRKQQQDPFNRETILGLPIVAGKHGSRRFCGPLFYFQVKVEHDPLKNEVFISRLTEEPLLNMSLLSTLVGDEAEGDLVRRKLLPLVLEETFDNAVIEKAARVASELVRGLRGLRRLGSSFVPLSDCLQAREQESPVYFHACAVINAPRSHAFLLDDLSALSKLESPPEGTALDLFLEETEDPLPDQEDPVRVPDAGPLYFPLLSNPAQRRAAVKAEKARLMTIQGPPGTGKSLTIANLVCHLVARGHSVLVTSHQNKALEVVTDKLPQIDYLAMSLLKGDKQSVEILRTKLEQYESITASVPPSELARTVERSLLKLEGLKRRICTFHARFAELKELERTQESPYRRYDEVRGYDGISPQDTPGVDIAFAEATLKQWRTYLTMFLSVFPHLYRFYVVDGGITSSAEALECSPAVQELLALAEDAIANFQHQSTNRDQIDAYVGLTRPIVEETGSDYVWTARLVAQILAAACSVMRGLQENNRSTLWSDWSALAQQLNLRVELDSYAVQETINWLEASAFELAESLDLLCGDLSLGVARQLYAEVDQGAVSELASQVRAAIANLHFCPAPSEITLTTDSKTVQHISQILQVLETGRHSWLSWHLLPSCRTARKMLRELGYPVLSYNSAEQALVPLRTWEKHWRLRHWFTALGQHLQQIGIPAEVPPADALMPALRKAVQKTIASITVIQLIGKQPKWSGSAPLGEAIESRLDAWCRGEQVKEGVEGFRILFSVLQARAEVQRWVASPARNLVSDQLAPVCEAVTELKITSAAQKAWDWASALLEPEADPLPMPVALHMEHRDRLWRLQTEHSWRSRHRECWFDFVAKIVEGKSAADSETISALESLRAVAQYTSQFAEYLDFANDRLKQFGETQKSVEAEVRDGRIPGWLMEPGKALEAHRLRKLLVDDLCSCPDDINNVAQAASKAQEEYRLEVERFLEYSRRLEIKKAQIDPKCHRNILKLRTLLGRKRKTPSLLKLRDQIDYGQLLKVFPCWIMSIEDVARVFPLVPGLFDYVIVDEASQCQQAAALHLAYRGKRLLVVGDQKQLQSASTRFLSNQTVQFLLAHHQLSTEDFKFDARRSFLDLAEYCSQGKEFLNEHFRCEPSIIAWSNKLFYDGHLVVVTPVRSPRFNPCLEFRLLRGADDDPEKKVNEVEAQAVVEEVRRLIESGEANGLSIGIISPFREQANRIHSLVHETLANHPDWIKRHEIVSATADGFQGDERDIVLYSFRYGASTSSGTIKAIELERERLNVAFTRARRKVICFSSVTPDRFPEGLIRSFLEHSITSQQQGTDPLFSEDNFDSEFERRVCQRLRGLGYTVSTQVPCGPFRIDLVVRDDEGRRLAVECDGDFHYDEEGYLRPEDYQRQDLLERAGWTVHRVPCRRFYWDSDSTMAELVEVLKQQETESERTLVQKNLDEDESELGLMPEAGEQEERGEESEHEEYEQQRAVASGSFVGSAPEKITPVASPRESRGEATVPLDSSEMLRPESWFQLSHWGKSTGVFSPYNNRFCYGFGKVLAQKRTPTARQVDHANSLWKLAVRRGFHPGEDHGGAERSYEDRSVTEQLQRPLPMSEEAVQSVGQNATQHESLVYICDRGRIHTRTTCPALVNQDSAPSEMKLKDALTAGHTWCSWCLRHRSVAQGG